MSAGKARGRKRRVSIMQRTKPKVAIIAPGNMGAGAGRRLVDNGLEVLTSLEGRSAASRKRAEEAGMAAVGLGEIMRADFLLSIVPPAEALALAESLAPRLAARSHRMVYVDCNAVSPRTVRKIGDALERVTFVDAGIIGLPPQRGEKGPTIYASGNAAARFGELAEYGLSIKVLDGPIGAASALKMSYAGITKGLSGLGAAMLLAASREGAAEALRAELQESQPALLARFVKALPQMYSKAHRWVAEMEEIAEFLGEDKAAATMFGGLARLYERLATDYGGQKGEIGAIESFLSPAQRAAETPTKIVETSKTR
jgi:3-hydroxyisobutyrate dehydrogenase-like beta-hydroxyacid dehydrogenase